MCLSLTILVSIKYDIKMLQFSTLKVVSDNKINWTSWYLKDQSREFLSF